MVRISSTFGSIDVGPQNGAWGHIYTDRPKFILNKPLYIIGGAISSYSTSSLFLQTGGVTRMTIKTDGRVLTTGHIEVPYRKRIILGSGDDVNSRLEFLSHDTYQNAYIDFRTNLFFRAADKVWVCPMLLQYDGSVGIGFITTGTTEGMDYTKGYKLAVNGGIICEEVKVIEDVPNSDHVFQSEYDLMGLDDLEAFVLHNKHLPGVPTAEQFKKNGYKIGEMDNLLLQKIEELTLYVIELKKQNNKLTRRVEELENSNL